MVRQIHLPQDQENRDRNTAVQFVAINRDTPYLLPASIQDYLPEDHLARFVVEIVDQLDMGSIQGVYAGKGKKPYHPAMLVALLFYGYATGTFSSRKLEKATYDSIAYLYICANAHPVQDTIATFRKRCLKELESFCVEILMIGQAMGLVKLGTVSLDGTKIRANASKAQSAELGAREAAGNATSGGGRAFGLCGRSGQRDDLNPTAS